MNDVLQCRRKRSLTFGRGRLGAAGQVRPAACRLSRCAARYLLTLTLKTGFAREERRADTDPIGGIDRPDRIDLIELT
jgi:hypothetical protein